MEDRIQEIQNTGYKKYKIQDTRNTKYLAESGGHGYKKYKIPEKRWMTSIQEIQNT